MTRFLSCDHFCHNVAERVFCFEIVQTDRVDLLVVDEVYFDRLKHITLVLFRTICFHLWQNFIYALFLGESHILLYRKIAAFFALKHFLTFFLFWPALYYWKNIVWNVISWLVNRFILSTGLDEKGLDIFGEIFYLLKIVVDSSVCTFAFMIFGIFHVPITSFSN